MKGQGKAVEGHWNAKERQWKQKAKAVDAEGKAMKGQGKVVEAECKGSEKSRKCNERPRTGSGSRRQRQCLSHLDHRDRAAVQLCLARDEDESIVGEEERAAVDLVVHQPDCDLLAAPHNRL